ncbi:hypothetical protein FOZ62_031832, partial [Perkinsus olseni]
VLRVATEDITHVLIVEQCNLEKVSLSREGRDAQLCFPQEQALVQWNYTGMFYLTPSSPAARLHLLIGSDSLYFSGNSKPPGREIEGYKDDAGAQELRDAWVTDFLALLEHQLVAALYFYGSASITVLIALAKMRAKIKSVAKAFNVKDIIITATILPPMSIRRSEAAITELPVFAKIILERMAVSADLRPYYALTEPSMTFSGSLNLALFYIGRTYSETVESLKGTGTIDEHKAREALPSLATHCQVVKELLEMLEESDKLCAATVSSTVTASDAVRDSSSIELSAPQICGDGIHVLGEECDGASVGCSSKECTVLPSYACIGSSYGARRSRCMPINMD